MNTITFKNSKNNILQQPKSRLLIRSKNLSLSQKNSSFFQTLKKSSNYSSPVRRNPIQQNRLPHQMQKLSNRNRLSIRKEDIKNLKMKIYFKCVNISSLENPELDQLLINEFFKQDFLSSNVFQQNKQIEEISESFEVLELNNKSIHISKLLKSFYPDSSNSSNMKEIFSPFSKMMSNTKENCPDKKIKEINEKIREVREVIKNSNLGKEAQKSCLFHLDRINQIVVQEKTGRTETSFSQLLNNKNMFARKNSKPKSFKFI